MYKRLLNSERVPTPTAPAAEQFSLLSNGEGGLVDNFSFGDLL